MQSGSGERLRVERTGPRTGALWWRRAEYSVYRVRADGHQEEVLVGLFHDHAQALRAAHVLLESAAAAQEQSQGA